MEHAPALLLRHHCDAGGRDFLLADRPDDRWCIPSVGSGMEIIPVQFPDLRGAITAARRDFIWNSMMDDEGGEDMDGSFVIVARGRVESAGSPRYSGASGEFFIDRPMLVSASSWATRPSAAPSPCPWRPSPASASRRWG